MSVTPRSNAREVVVSLDEEPTLKSRTHVTLCLARNDAVELPIFADPALLCQTLQGYLDG